jgi:mycothiol synthase
VTLTISDLIIRPAERTDAQRVLDLLVHRDMRDFGEADSDMEDLTHEWGQIDLKRDAWLAMIPSGELVGYACVLPWASGLRYDVAVDPSWDDDLGGVLLERCEQRAIALSEDRVDAGGTVVHCYTAEGDGRQRARLERTGFGAVMLHRQMQIEVQDVPVVPRLPSGILCRMFVPGSDDRAVHALIQEAFDRPGRRPHPFEDWREFMMRPDIFEPELWFLAEAGSDLVGACLCFEYPELGWVRQLGVAQARRHMGLGSALLHQAFLVFQGRGQRRVGLTVASQNAGAFVFYQSIGMYPIRQYVEYQKLI